MNRTLPRVAVGALLVLLVAASAYWVGLQRGDSDAPPANRPSSDRLSANSGEPEVAYWVAPMDPQFRRDRPGKSPMGMDLVPVYVVDDENEAGVRISPNVEQNLGVRTETVERGPLWRLIRATGRVEVDESRLAHVHLRTSGWVESSTIDTNGQSVAAGAVIAEIYSPDLVSAQNEFLNARRRGSQPLLDGATEKLRALGFTADDLTRLRSSGSRSQTFAVTAPQTGVVTNLNMREGMFIEPGTALLSVVDLSRVWVQAEVLEAQAAWVSVGQSADMSLQALPGEVFSGTVAFVDPFLDPETRTLSVRLEFDNPELRLKPNMFASVKIYGGARRNVLSVPVEALIVDEHADRIVVALGDGRFESREVVAGMRSGRWVEIIDGLAEGDEVVVSAQFLIDSEASLAGTIRRLGESVERASPDTRETGMEKLVQARGVVTARDWDQVTINHEPIKVLDWPRMTMKFGFSGSAPDESITVGSRVEFTLLRQSDGGFLIGSIEQLPEANR